MSAAGFKWQFDEVLARTDLRSLLDEVTASNGRVGSSAKWHCPAPEHADQRPSVTISADHQGKERWRCWSNSDHRGDAIDLVRTIRGVDSAEAADWLAGRAGMILDKPLPPRLPTKKATPRPPVTLDPSVERYVTIAEAVLRSPQGEPMREWLAARGIGPDVIRVNRLGADVGRKAMNRRRGLPYGAGPGVVFPALDPAGKIAYVQTRYLDPDAAGRKYDNPASALGANPRLAFIRVPDALPQRAGMLVVTEGIPDGLVAASGGFASVSLMGSQTADPISAVRLVDHASDRSATIALVLDADEAGSQAVETLTGHFETLGVSPVVVSLPDGLDLNDFALRRPGWADELAVALHADTGLDHRDLEAGGQGVGLEY